MARRRDRISRQSAKIARAMGAGTTNTAHDTGVNRMTGRRGVRARAREARIEARQAAGTYTAPNVRNAFRRVGIYRQPDGGDTTNS